MPDPGYQRESATTLWSTRTARTLEGPPRRRCGVRPYGYSSFEYDLTPHLRQDVRRPAQTEVRRQVVLKRGVAVWPGAKQDTVDPDGAVAIHAIETDGDFPATRGNR